MRACDRLNPLGLAALDSSAETLVEALYAATSGRLLLLARVERVAVGADFNTQFRLGRASRERVSAGACHRCFSVVLRVYSCFHFGLVSSRINAG